MQNNNDIQIPFTDFHFTITQLIISIIAILVLIYVIMVIIPTILKTIFDLFRNPNKPFKHLTFKQNGPTHHVAVVKLNRFSNNRIQQLHNSYYQGSEVNLKGGTATKVSSITLVHKKILDRIILWNIVNYQIILEDVTQQ
ncbi:hypothetical protein [uncultured Fructobacillus sp.]|uniref:hypothetical protein n=1 Tax=uncultured Fructobacillus sp. TaxID=591942 RepID=UPI00259A3345|nr:hypothetical protein [uncultured Fructobacillus sp.]